MDRSMEELLAQLDNWADGEPLPISEEVDAEETLSVQQKRSLWALLNRHGTSRTTLSQPGPALR